MSTTQDASGADALPEITNETIERIEAAVFADIAADRQRRRARRGRVWAGAGAAAAVVVVAAIVGPSLAGGSGAFSGASNEAGEPIIGQVQDGDMVVVPESVDGARADGSMIDGSATGGAIEGGSAIAGGAETAESDASGDRELIASGSLSLRVDDIDASAAAVAGAAEARGGYVESLNVGSNGMIMDIDGMTTMPASPNGAWVQVRVPADQLIAMIDELSSLGEVTASNISRQDVTEQAVDLRARITSAETSVARLTELMSQSASLADLIAAESALAERQATLESLQQQLEMLQGQVEMSSLSVDLTLAQERVEADPAGFGDGLMAGWNGLVATLNGIVIGLGFLLPWIVVIGVAGTIVWVIRRAIRRGRMRRAELRARATIESSTGHDGDG